MPLTPTIRYVAPAGSDTNNNCTSPATPCRTIQRAVNQAVSGDEIHIAEGVYSLTAGAQLVYLTKSVTLRGGYSANFGVWDPDIHISALDAQNLGRCIYITGGAQPLIEWLHITHGNAAGLGGGPSPLSYDAGGGVYVNNADPTLRHNHITDNQAQIGGGVWFSSSNGTLSDNLIIYHSHSTLLIYSYTCKKYAIDTRPGYRRTFWWQLKWVTEPWQSRPFLL